MGGVSVVTGGLGAVFGQNVPFGDEPTAVGVVERGAEGMARGGEAAVGEGLGGEVKGGYGSEEE